MADLHLPASSVENLDVSSDRILIVEGSFDLGFLHALLRRNNRRRVQVLTVDGKDNFKNRALTRLTSDDGLILRWIGLARDADDNPGGAFASLQQTMRRFKELRPEAGFGVSEVAWSRIDHGNGKSSTLFVFPSATDSGDIEAWIWPALRPSPVTNCVDEFVTCLVTTGHEVVRASKARIYAYLAALASPEMPLEAAARAASIPMDSQHFQQFLDQIPDDDEVL